MSIFSVLSFGQLSEGFEGATFPPTGWEKFDNGIGTAQSWSSTNVAAQVHTGLKAAYLNREGAAPGNTPMDWLVTPQVLVPANGQLRFFTKLTLAGDQGSIYTVRISTTSQTTEAAFTTVKTWTEVQIMSLDDLGTSGSTLAQQSTYLQKKINLAAYAGQNVYIAFVMAGNNADRWCIDDVVVDQQCLINTNLTATPFANSASLNWTSSATGPWEIEYGPAGFTQGTGTIVTAPTKPFTLAPLTPLTNYSYYVRSVCSADNVSPWSLVKDFTTSALPPGCGGNFVDSGGPTGNYPNNQDIVYTICPDNLGDYVTVIFTMFNTEVSYDKLYVYDGDSTAAPQISSTNGGGFGTVTLPGGFWGNLTGANLPGPFEATSASGCLTFRFVSDGIVNNPGWTANITCQPFPSCPKPTNITATATTSSNIVVNWTNNAPGATAWEVFWVPAGSPAPLPGAVGTITTNPSPFTIPGLASQTTYDIYVRAICGASDVGPWSSVKGTATTNPNYCGGDHFYDLGGPSGNYPNNANSVVTICADNPGDVVTVYFNTFDLVASLGDTLTIYDGDSTTGTVIGVYYGTNIIPFYTATSPSGCLTFKFVSNGSLNATGWDASIVCGPPCPSITSVLNSTVPAAGAENVIRICPGGTVDFSGSGVFAADGTGATYVWNFDDGTTASGQNVSHTFATEGIYLVNLVITDANGCRNNNILNQKVYVATTPLFTGSAPYKEEICLGQTTTITGVATPVPFVRECAPPVSGTTFLPDGSGVSYQTVVPVDCFPFGSTITSANQITSVCIDMEHSYAGDLEIRLVSPNGQSIILKAYPGGGGTYIGCPLDDPAVGPGTGRTYCFTPTATTLLVNGATSPCGVPSGNSYNAGNYMPQQPFNNLIGSPLNGNWSIIVTDNLGIDNGYIFSWGINFDNSILPTDYSFAPTIQSSNWAPDPSIVATSGETITVTPTTVGTHCYTYSVTDNFGCTYTKEVCIEVLPGVTLTDIDPSAAVCVGGDGTFTLTGSPAAIVTYNINGGVDQTVALDGVTGIGTVSLTGLTSSTTINATYITAPAVPTTGNVISTTGGVNPNNSVGAILPAGTAANATNSTTVNAANPTVTMTLGNVLPPGTAITISIAKNNNAGSVNISDGVNTQLFNVGALNVLQYFTFTTGAFTDVITFTRVNGNTYVDGIAYSYDELGCDSPLAMSETILITTSSASTFSPIASICAGLVAPSLPNTSIEGFTGTWSPAVIDTAIAGTFTYTFTPTAGQCAGLGTLEVVITPGTPTTFAPISDLCIGAVAPNLPAISIEGYTGVWTPAFINTTTAGSTTYTFTPDAGQCNNGVGTLVVVVNPGTPTTFNAIPDLCIGSSDTELPLQSIEGIAGTWSPASINTTAAGTFTYTFTPDASACANPSTLTVVVEVCNIPKGISPNNDTLNDSWDLSSYNVQKVEIYNRYGTKVYNKSNYTNEWVGQSNSGHELPDGTYYYVIEISGFPAKTGWVYINRER